MNDEYADKLYAEYSAQREKLDDASLEAAGRYDRAMLTISTGALALTVTFIAKIAPDPRTWTLVLLIPGWILLLATVVFQLLALSASHNSTREQITILDAEYNMYFGADDTEEAVLKGWTSPPNPYIPRTMRFNLLSQFTLVIGIVLILAFSSVNICCRKESNMAAKKSTPKTTTIQDTSKHIRGSYTPPKNKLPPPPKKGK